MPKFFICYRREDSQYPAQMIYQKLISEYDADSVVFDVDSVPLGADFREYLDERRCLDGAGFGQPQCQEVLRRI